jgi:hypothetical protein
MAIFVKVNSDNIVIDGMVVEPEMLATGLWGDPSEWIQTSYNTIGGVHYGQDGLPDGGIPLRMNYASPGCIYHPEADAFSAPQPFPSWTLNTDTYIWEPPVAYPSDGNAYYWEEITLTWQPDTMERIT